MSSPSENPPTKTLEIDDSDDFLTLKVNGVVVEIDTVEAIVAMQAIDARHPTPPKSTDTDAETIPVNWAFLAEVRDWVQHRYPQIPRVGLNTGAAIYNAVCEAREGLKKNIDSTPGSVTSSASTAASGAEPVSLRSPNSSPAAAPKEHSSKKTSADTA